MIRNLAVGLVLLGAVVCEAQTNLSLNSELVLIEAGRTINDLLNAEPYDVYEFVVTNFNGTAASSVELQLDGDFLNLGDTTFKVGAENPMIFGFEAPDSFFVLPDGVDPADVLAVNVEDSSTRLAASYTIAGGAELIPANGSVTLATLSTPAGAEPSIRFIPGRAFFGVSFVGRICFPTCIPEPSAGVMACAAILGALARRRS